MKTFSAILLLFILACEQSQAVVVERVSVSERIENSHLVAIGKIIDTRPADDENYTMEAVVLIKQSSIDQYLNSRVKFYHSANIEEKSTHCCGVGSTYLLFFKIYQDGYASSSGRYGAYEIISEVPLFLDETWMRTSLEHAEVLLYLHALSQTKREK